MQLWLSSPKALVSALALPPLLKPLVDDVVEYPQPLLLLLAFRLEWGELSHFSTGASCGLDDLVASMAF